MAKFDSFNTKIAYFEGDEEYDAYYLIRQELADEEGQDIFIPAPEMGSFIEGLLSAQDMIESKNVH
jgi:hypothetical protein